MIRTRRNLAAFAAIGVLALASCGSDSESSDTTAASVTTTADTTAESTADTTAETTADTEATEETTADTEATEETTADTEATEETTADTEAAADAWTVDVDACSDPEAATAAIEGTLKIGSAMPLSVSPAAAAFSPVKDGFELYIKYANDNGLLDGVTLEATIGDDQYDATVTPGVVDGLIDDGVHIFSGIIGTANNEAVRDTLNEECIPQLLNLTGAPEWGDDVADYPWTTGALVPYDIEAGIYANSLLELIGEGGTVGLFSVNNEFGDTFANAFRDAAEEVGLEIVEEQTIEELDSNPPTNQVGALASAAPQAVVAVPLGAQCPTFLKEMKNAEAATGWEPLVFQTNTCASRLLIQLLAGGAGDTVYTSTNIYDPSDPANADNPGVQTFVDAYNAAGLGGDLGTTAVGWSTAESTVNILIKAQESGTLSRQSIIEAARNLTFTPSLALPGADYSMNGEDDPYSFQTLQVEQWNEANALFTFIGEPDSSNES